MRRIPGDAPYHRRTREIDIVTRGVGEYFLNLAILGQTPKVSHSLSCSNLKMPSSAITSIMSAAYALHPKRGLLRSDHFPLAAFVHAEGCTVLMKSAVISS